MNSKALTSIGRAGATIVAVLACSPANTNSAPELPAAEECSALPAPDEPELYALRPEQRAAFSAARDQGVAVVRYEKKGCDFQLEVLNNCVAPGRYEYVPHWERVERSAKDTKELLAKLPVGAFSVAGEFKDERVLHTDSILAGVLQLPIGSNFDASQLIGDCSSATHIVTRMYVGGFAMVSGTSRDLAGTASVFVEAGTRMASSVKVVRNAGDPQSCEQSRQTQTQTRGCSTPLRMTLLPLSQARECMGVDECAARCDQGDVQSCVLLGFQHAQGIGVPASFERAVPYYRLACDRGNPAGCGYLGDLFLQGVGVPQDFRQAALLLQRACDGGVPWGCGLLGSMYALGAGMPVNPFQAAVFYHQACLGGEAEGCAAAVGVWTDACDAGDARACFELSGMYGRGDGVPKDPGLFANLVEKSCAGGEVDACMQLGTLYLRGEGVPRDVDKAFALYERYCNALQARGCVALGIVHYVGDGTPKDASKAFAYFERACDAGERIGCAEMANCYLEGRGVERNPGRALSLLMSSCDADCGVCCTDAARIHEAGDAGPVDLARARDLYRRGCNAGTEDACRALDRLQSVP